MNYKKLYKLARISVRLCTELEKVGCDSRKLSSRCQQLSNLAKIAQNALSHEEQHILIKLIGNLNGLRIECKRKFWERIEQERGPFNPGLGWDAPFHK